MMPSEMEEDFLLLLCIHRVGTSSPGSEQQSNTWVLFCSVLLVSSESLLSMPNDVFANQ